MRSLEPAWEPGWEPPWELGWELGVLELEELPLLVLCSGLSTMGSVLLRSGLLQEHKTEGLPSAGVTRASGASDPSHTDGRKGEETPSLLEETGLRSSLPKPLSRQAPPRDYAELGTGHLCAGAPQPRQKIG